LVALLCTTLVAIAPAAQAQWRSPSKGVVSATSTDHPDLRLTIDCGPGDEAPRAVILIDPAPANGEPDDAGAQRLRAASEAARARIRETERTAHRPGSWRAHLNVETGRVVRAALLDRLSADQRRGYMTMDGVAKLTVGSEAAERYILLDWIEARGALIQTLPLVHWARLLGADEGGSLYLSLADVQAVFSTSGLSEAARAAGCWDLLEEADLAPPQLEAPDFPVGSLISEADYRKFPLALGWRMSRIEQPSFLGGHYVQVFTFRDSADRLIAFLTYRKSWTTLPSASDAGGAKRAALYRVVAKGTVSPSKGERVMRACAPSLFPTTGGLMESASYAYLKPNGKQARALVAKNGRLTEETWTIGRGAKPCEPAP